MNDHINDGNFSTKKDLQSFLQNVEQLEAIYDKSNQTHSQNIEQAFVDNEKVENLDQISDILRIRLKKYRKI
ncbi:putative conjugative transfer TraG domain protein [Orientia tsutsugamushi str. UT76]|nr:putative conjugative transfer TraG domain protein [Orientia tsutsugamushi str. UT76]